jgi:membrane protein implicated in regulation of membrane protease activity
MINEVISHPWALWAIVAVISAIIEIVVPSFSFIFAAVAGLVTALAANYTGWPVQIATFIGVLFLSVLFLRPKFMEKFHSGKKIISRADALLNKEGLVTEAIDSEHKMGRVLVDGQDWSARGENAVDLGKKIIVNGSDGIVLSVKEIK